MPKIEEQLLQATEEYESESGKLFTIKGLPVNEYLEQSKVDYEKEKENLKLARVGNKRLLFPFFFWLEF